ncbi:hypothetical protein [Mesorhizobium loti]|uniref:hypothetical protein n=1 Tax=Rhizobium loti TaxID=381 RepID=UPI0003F5A710|nr:hypothetical protein [Mesorhizobium loti]
MSAFIAGVGEHSAILITDAAAYDAGGTVVAIAPKVTTGKVSPIAVTTRGAHVLGMRLQQAICDQADQFGVDYALENFAREFPRVGIARHGSVDMVHVHIIAWSLTHGAIQLSAHNCPHAFGDGQEPLVVTAPAGHYIAGTHIDQAGLTASGMRKRHEGEDLVPYLTVEGVKLMEAMRLAPAKPIEGDSWAGEQYLIGGHIDVTVVEMLGAKTETVRTWPDVVGQKIVPSVEAALSNINALLGAFVARTAARKSRKQ